MLNLFNVQIVKCIAIKLKVQIRIQTKSNADTNINSKAEQSFRIHPESYIYPGHWIKFFLKIKGHVRYTWNPNFGFC